MKIYKNSSISLSLALVALFWMGCGSPVPISDATDALMVPELVGQWQTVTPATEDGQMLVLKYDAQTYYVELREAGTEPFDGDTIRLRVYITEVEGKPFINAQNIDSLDGEDRVYFFYTYNLSPDGLLTLTELQDVGDQKIDEFETSEALHAFIQQNLFNDALYGDEMTLMKVKVAG